MSDPTLRRRLTAGLLLSGSLALAACGATGGSSSPAASGGTSPSASVDAGSASPSASSDVAGGGEATFDDPCSLATPEDVAAVIGSDVTSQSRTTETGGACAYTPSGEGGGFVTITTVGSDGAAALEGAISDFTLGETSTPIGDASAGVDGTIFVVVGDQAFSIVALDSGLQPVALSELETLAGSIVERLGGPTGGGASPSASPSADASASASPSP